MKVEIDQKSGFCFGVVKAIEKAEECLENEKTIFCLGDVVHNEEEMKRLSHIGLISIDYKKYYTLKNCKVLIRAHGEPPATYKYANENNIELIDATCPVVLKLQQRIKNASNEQYKKNGQIVIFGKNGHAEVVGLKGQTKDQAIIIESSSDIEKIDHQKPLVLFSQTTRSVTEFHQIADIIKEKSKDTVQVKDTICRQVANRVPHLKKFALQFDVIVFVGGRKSSNAMALFNVCKETNPNSYFVSSVSDLSKKWFAGMQSAGICGGTSTPQWLMEEIASVIRQF